MSFPLTRLCLLLTKVWKSSCIQEKIRKYKTIKTKQRKKKLKENNEPKKHFRKRRSFYDYENSRSWSLPFPVSMMVDMNKFKNGDCLSDNCLHFSDLLNPKSPSCEKFIRLDSMQICMIAKRQTFQGFKKYLSFYMPSWQTINRTYYKFFKNAPR